MIHEALETLLTPIVVDLGCELWACEYLIQGKHSLVRLYIDKPEGITLDDCEKVSREVSVLLDVQSPIASQYTLEVSSPGLDRPLCKKEHFQRYIGSLVLVKIKNPIDKRRKITGLLSAVDDATVVVDTVAIPMANIIKANLVSE